MKFTAMLLDSCREAWDRRIFLVLVVISLLLTLFCLSMEFHREPPERIFQRAASDIGWVRVAPMYEAIFDPEARVSDLHRLEEAAEFGEAFEGGYVFRLHFGNPGALHDAAKLWKYAPELEKPASWSEELGHFPDPAPQQVARYVSSVLFQWGGVKEVFLDQGLWEEGRMCEVRVAVGVPDPNELVAVHRVSLFFGAIKPFSVWERSMGEILLWIETTLATFLAGWVGLIIAVLATGGFFPSMLAKGSVDILLSKPIGRSRLYLYKYVGGLAFVFFNVAVLVGGTWLALAARSGVMHWRYLLTIPLLTFLFAILYSLSCLFAVMRPSAAFSVLMTMGVWFASSTVTNVYHMLTTRGALPFAIPDWLVSVAKVLYWIFPNTPEIGGFIGYAIAQDTLWPEMMERTGYEAVGKVDYVLAFGSSTAFLVVMFLLGAWLFRRKDY